MIFKYSFAARLLYNIIIQCFSWENPDEASKKVGFFHCFLLFYSFFFPGIPRICNNVETIGFPVKLFILFNFFCLQRFLGYCQYNLKGAHWWKLAALHEEWSRILISSAQKEKKSVIVKNHYYGLIFSHTFKSLFYLMMKDEKLELSFTFKADVVPRGIQGSMVWNLKNEIGTEIRCLIVRLVFAPSCFDNYWIS